MSFAFLIWSMVSPRITDTFFIFSSISLILGFQQSDLPSNWKNLSDDLIFFVLSGGLETPGFFGSLTELKLARKFDCLTASFFDPAEVCNFEPLDASEGDLESSLEIAFGSRKFVCTLFRLPPIFPAYPLLSGCSKYLPNTVFFRDGSWCSCLEFLSETKAGVELEVFGYFLSYDDPTFVLPADMPYVLMSLLI